MSLRKKIVFYKYKGRGESVVEEMVQKEKSGQSVHPLKLFFWKGATIFLVVAACLLFACFIFRFNEVMHMMHQIIGILQPIIYGLVIAYLLNPIMVFWQKHLSKFLLKRMKNERKANKIARTCSIFLSLLLFLTVLLTIAYTVLPELFISISNMVKDLPEQMDEFVAWIQGVWAVNTDFGDITEEVITSVTTYVEEWIETDLLTQLNILLSQLTMGVVGVFNVFQNLFIGLIVSIYVLINKETFIGQSKKIVYAIFKPKQANVLVDTVRTSHRIFSGFISGKLIDSFIIGMLCFIVLTILQMPYTLLVSVIVGITNIIPFFGPYIGAIPSAILILLVDPKQGIVFIIFIILLQQLDGNIIGPKILGESTGLSAFWVVFAILLGGGLFGFIGMIIGVPTFAVIYRITKQIIEYRLAKKKLPIESYAYQKVERIEGNQEIILQQEIEPKEEESKKASKEKETELEKKEKK